MKGHIDYSLALTALAFLETKIIEVEFRTRVLSGESALDERAPFDVWLYNGTVRADLSVGPRSITALGSQESRPFTPTIILNKPINGTDWHVYRYRLDPSGIQWWVDGISVGSATIEMLIPAVASETDRRINMFITSASANVELDYLIVKQTPQPPCTLNLVASFTDQTLSLDFDLGTREPATWNIWLVAQTEVTPLVSAALPVIEPPVPVEVDIPFFPALGTVGLVNDAHDPGRGNHLLGVRDGGYWSQWAGRSPLAAYAAGPPGAIGRRAPRTVVAAHEEVRGSRRRTAPGEFD